MAGETIVGIAFGTTNCCVGIWRNGRVEVIPDDDGNRIIPACVSFTQSQRLTGAEAKDQVAVNPKNTIVETKRMLGLPYEDLHVDIGSWPFKVMQQDSLLIIDVEQNGSTLTPVDVIGFILSYLKNLAETYLSAKVAKAVIAIPAYFTDSQRQAMNAAASLAALEVTLMHEPLAAVIAHGLSISSETSNILVFHCGGRTTSVTILSVEGQEILIKGSASDPHLGGNDFDARLFSHCQKIIMRQSKINVKSDKRSCIRLENAIEKAKIKLSTNEQTVIQVDSLQSSSNHLTKDFSCKLFRSEFEDMCFELFFTAVSMIDDVLTKCNLSKEHINHILMTGGSSKIPKIKLMIEDHFYGKEITKYDAIPFDLAVVYGTVMQAGNQSLPISMPDTQSAVPKRATVCDVNPPAPKKYLVDGQEPCSSRDIPAFTVKKEKLEAVASTSCKFEDGDDVKVKIKSETEGPVIGIDLGTTYSCVGIWRNGEVEIIPNELGRMITSSCVAFTDTCLLVGDAAKDHAAIDPSNTIFEAKRLIGRKFADEKVQEDMKNWPFTVICENMKPKIEVIFKKRRQRFHAEDISGFVLSKLKAMAEEYTGRTISKAVITVPAYFNNLQRQSTKTAGRLAGLEVLKIINEPTAAAIAYGLDYVESGYKNILVYDLGGGTFDVSILRIEGKELTVKATAGDTHLGGEDFDTRLVAHFKSKFHKQYGHDISRDKRAIRRLRNACEKAKRNLSGVEKAIIDIDRLYKGLDYQDSITRIEFEILCSDLFLQTLQPLSQVLADAGMRKDEISDLVLVGGSTRIPSIRQLVRNFFDGKEIKKDINADEAVARGAVIQSAMLSDSKELGLEDIRVRDVTPLSLGISVFGGLMSTIVPRNTAIPVERSNIYRTSADYQTSCGFQVLQGERTMAKDNTSLGRFTVTGIPSALRGCSSFPVVFTFDVDGILLVKCQPYPGAPFQTMQIDDPCDISEFEVRRMIASAEVVRESDRKERERVNVRNELYLVCYDKRHDEQDGDMCRETLKWLEENPNASTEVLTLRLVTHTFD